MSVMIYDSTSQAFKEAQTPKVYDTENQAWRETVGMVYDKNDGAWIEKWGSSNYWFKPNTTNDYIKDLEINTHLYWGHRTPVAPNITQSEQQLTICGSRTAGTQSNVLFPIKDITNYTKLHMSISCLDDTSGDEIRIRLYNEDYKEIVSTSTSVTGWNGGVYTQDFDISEAVGNCRFFVTFTNYNNKSRTPTFTAYDIHLE